MPNSLSDPRYRRIVDSLREARISAGLTQAALAQKLGRPQSFVAKIERLERRLDILEFAKIVEAVGADTTEILYG